MIVIPELVDGCHLTCALCWNRDRIGSFKQMTLSTVEKIVKKYGSDIKNEIQWFNWGEPLLHNNFEEISKMVKETNSFISSSFSLQISNERFEALKNFKQVWISLSGITPEVYNVYQCGGDFELVMENIKKLFSLKLKKVVIKWQHHKYNREQYHMGAQFAMKYGFVFQPIILNCEIENSIDGFSSDLVNNKPRGPVCLFNPWLPIDVDGNYLLCCKSHNVKIGYTIDDNISYNDILEAKKNTDLCKICTEKMYW